MFIKIYVFWGKKPCRLVNSYWNFGGAYCLHLQDLRILLTPRIICQKTWIFNRWLTCNWCIVLNIGLKVCDSKHGRRLWQVGLPVNIRCFFDAGVVEIPAIAISILFLLKMGRRWPLCLTLMGSGVACLLTLTITPGMTSGSARIWAVWRVLSVIKFKIRIIK
jgi:hypothetical protein